MLGDNLKFLRKHHKISQQQLSEDLNIPRTTLGDYERGYTEPSLATLQRLSKYFDISLDRLIKTKLNKSNVTIASTDELKVLAISVDQQNNNHIDLVETKAAAGYLDNHSDPEYIKDLPKIAFPNIPSGTFRGFEIKGDSMLPMEEGSIVICSYIERLSDIKNGKTYVIISKENGVVYKRVTNEPSKKSLQLQSDNEIYRPYALEYKDIDEVWQYYAHLSFDDSFSTFNQMLDEKLSDINRKVTEIHHHIVK